LKETFLFRSFFVAYQLLWYCLTPFLVRSKRVKEGAEERTLQKINFSKVDLWIHAASAGEAYLAIQLVKCLGSGGGLDILITTNTSQGRMILENDSDKSAHRITVAFMVFDNPSLIKKAVRIADPAVLVLIELEIWPALMAEMKRAGKKIIIVNGRMTEKSFDGYKKLGFLWRELKPDTILAISAADRKRFVELFDQPSTFHVNNMKFDRMERCQVATEEKGEKQLLVLASVRREEAIEVLYLIEELQVKFPDLQISLFPRHMHWLENWGKLLSEKKINWVLKSVWSPEDSCSLVLWDVFGELREAYLQADAVFVGGSLAPLGGQNFIEAFMSGVVPVTGPSISDFLWVGDEVFAEGLVRKGNSKEEVLRLLIESLENPVDKLLLQRKADNYISSKQGGSRKTCEYVEMLLNSYCVSIQRFRGNQKNTGHKNKIVALLGVVEKGIEKTTHCHTYHNALKFPAVRFLQFQGSEHHSGQEQQEKEETNYAKLHSNKQIFVMGISCRFDGSTFNEVVVSYSKPTGSMAKKRFFIK